MTFLFAEENNISEQERKKKGGHRETVWVLAGKRRFDLLVSLFLALGRNGNQTWFDCPPGYLVNLNISCEKIIEISFPGRLHCKSLM